MPCYDPRNEEPLKSQEEKRVALEAYNRGEFAMFYRNVTKDMLAEWLCDALRRVPDIAIHPHCLKWWELHKRQERRR